MLRGIPHPPYVANRGTPGTRKAMRNIPKYALALVIGIAESGAYTATAVKEIGSLSDNDLELLNRARTDMDTAFNLTSAEYLGWRTGPDRKQQQPYKHHIEEVYMFCVSE